MARGGRALFAGRDRFLDTLGVSFMPLRSGTMTGRYHGLFIMAMDGVAANA
jgi:hypothetical protein